ncbi:hypothetical protein DUT91_07620 [Phyllobacterium salinisoli]|uniref:Uncharacterized protein n=1 Tax=Phyllobacterium salinisoli TaxID=1899321 RepID=A0A368K7Z8_9HYPH|nr:hypothetical protein [Phyllobacterium salinisoli]RCS24180.1 hypothetical protein DUT91_07620 [Phyllobacterium salinisoli]
MTNEGRFDYITVGRSGSACASTMRDLIDKEIFPGAGMRDLRFTNASLMSTIASGNTNTAVLAAAGKADDLILA